ncbi:MAG: flavodoxin-dependent (E)-4-hydroxy-3-methylbut-2-enyl-diphosphate synthase [Alistipes indistinctus]
MPEAALVAAENVEGCASSPGNFNDRGGQFDRLVALCREHGTALRIGVNHGSLSAAVMERYGDTPEGMVASAVEYLALCRERGFDPVVVSLKSSERARDGAGLPAAGRRDARTELGLPAPPGVTEAGDDMEGRIKSAVGIGALLADGLGDTIRVSLTGRPSAKFPSHGSWQITLPPARDTRRFRPWTNRFTRRTNTAAAARSRWRASEVTGLR